MSKIFLDIPAANSVFADSRVAILPVPFEATVTYGKGTKKGPPAILSASQKVELYDQELDKEPYKIGVATLPILKGNIRNIQPKIESEISILLDKGKFPIMLGGEHSISVGAVKACKNKYADLSVLQLDAHADLREDYNGSKFSHACVMRRVREICPAVAAGIRSLSQEEMDFARGSGQIKKIFWADRLDIEKILAGLSSHVYITVDIDVFDPAEVPATGTPEPGGLNWYKVLEILKVVFRSKKVVGCDLVELAPIKGQHASEFLAAKLVYKLIGYYSTLQG